MTESLLAVRTRHICPVCHQSHCLTALGRIWTHGPRTARCRGSQRRPEGARYAARHVRGQPP